MAQGIQLIIVESPTKARTLSRFLGSSYTVEASMGHIRDLPKSSMGVDIEHGFVPNYIVPKDKSKHVTYLKSLAKKAVRIILATDPDREGEAIAWHIASVFTDSKVSSVPFERIAFHEITKSAITHALEHPRTVDIQLVNAQQARRVLDRLVGYTLSPLLWKKLSKRWLSAGRVQSVAVRLLVEREKEIAAFSKHPYWTIEASFEGPVTASLARHTGVSYEQSTSHQLFDGVYKTTETTIQSEPAAEQIIADVRAPFIVSSVEKKAVKRNPPAPFTTSTLQQDAGRKLYFSSKKTMQLAQKLYEEGIITYHRTDSVNLSEQFINEARAYIADTYGVDYVPKEARLFHTKSKVAQEAHEAIRPTNVTVHGTQLAEHTELNRDHVRLYELIWKRALASQAAPAVFDSTTIVIKSSNGYEFEASGSIVRFDGFFALTGRSDADDTLIPDVTEGQEITLVSMTKTAHETAPPPRYTESSLVKTLEEKGIGRPSTYAPIISTIIDRQYVTKDEKKLVPTELGTAVTEFLVTYFSNILDLPFTATLEDDLDAIANGQKEWVPVIAAFYAPFKTDIDNAYQAAQKVKLGEEAIDEQCPSCGSPLVIRMGKYGKFVACTNFPNCTYTRQYGQKADMLCPKCGSDILVKKSKRGKKFYGCSNYPTCTFAAWKKEEIAGSQQQPAHQ